MNLKSVQKESLIRGSFFIHAPNLLFSIVYGLVNNMLNIRLNIRSNIHVGNFPIFNTRIHAVRKKNYIIDGYSIMELSDGTFKNSNWEPIDPSKGEFAKWKIEKIDHQKVVFIFESFDSYVKQHWRFNFMYKRGNLNKYNAGETVELIPFPNEMKQYSIAQGKADVAAYSLIGFDPIRSSATENLKNYTIYLNQEKIITSFDWDYLAELYISSGLHDRMLLELKYNEVN